MSLNPLLAGLEPTHPGEILADSVEALLSGGALKTRAQLAGYLGMTRQMLDLLLKGRTPLKPEVALRLEALGVGRAEHWLAMQDQYELRLAQARLGDALTVLPSLTAA